MSDYLLENLTMKLFIMENLTYGKPNEASILRCEKHLSDLLCFGTTQNNAM